MYWDDLKYNYYKWKLQHSITNLVEKYVSNVSGSTDNCWNQLGIEYAVWDWVTYFCLLSLFPMQLGNGNLWITKIATKYSREKFCTHEISTRKMFVLATYPRGKVIDQWNAHEKKFWTQRNTHVKKFWTHQLPTKVRRYDISRPTRPTMARDLRNLADL